MTNLSFPRYISGTAHSLHISLVINSIHYLKLAQPQQVFIELVVERKFEADVGKALLSTARE